jgi:hypothetical protein
MLTRLWSWRLLCREIDAVPWAGIVAGEGIGMTKRNLVP